MTDNSGASSTSSGGSASQQWVESLKPEQRALLKRALTFRRGPYIPAHWKPHPKQRVALLLDAEELLYGGAAGGGKMLRLDEPVPTPAGWTTIGELRPGDLVFDESGRPTRVLQVFAVDLRPRSFRLTFDDGSTVEACEDHRWLTLDATERARGDAGTVRTTRQVVETLRTKSGRANHAMPIAAPLELPEANLQVDPYLLGAQLAVDLDGIPAAYLRASQEQRLAILQGLMDAGGRVCRSGAAEFTTTSSRLAEGALELILSLGWKAAIRTGRAELRGRDVGPKYTIKWTPDAYVFRLQRKRDGQRLATRRTTRFRYVVAAEPCPPVPMRCIAVENPRGLFLVGRSFLVTHNTDLLLAAAAQYLDVPGYHAAIFRRTFAQLSTDDGLIPRAHAWFGWRSDAHWSGQEHRWTFTPNPARGPAVPRWTEGKTSSLRFGYMDAASDVHKEQGAQFQFLGVDELTHLLESQWRYLFSRMRRTQDLVVPETGKPVPVRAYATSNPPDPLTFDAKRSGAWVKARFIDAPSYVDEEGQTKRRLFLQARLEDNPSLDQAGYRRQLAKLHPLQRRALELGDWSVRPEGNFFKHQWFKWVDAVPPGLEWVRCYDLAATEPTEANKDPDWTASLLVAAQKRDGEEPVIYLRKPWRMRGEPGAVRAAVRGRGAEEKGAVSLVHVNKDPAQAGKDQAQSYIAMLTALGFEARATAETGPKATRWAPLAAAASNGRVYLVREGAESSERRNEHGFVVEQTGWDWFLLEATSAPNGDHDDGLDAASRGQTLAEERIAFAWASGSPTEETPDGQPPELRGVEVW